MPKTALSVVVCLLAVLFPISAAAQMFEAVGIRAQGMGGGFVAVADDATATWWNPAGLATGAYFNALVEYDRRAMPRPEDGVKAFAVAFPAMGVSYYRLPINQMRPPAPTAAGLPDRQDQGVLGVYGITFGQSVGRHLVVASTVKLEHLNGTTGDVDAGAMANLGHLRLGIAVRNLREATFDDAAGAVTLTREARAGAAFVGRTAGVVSAIALAADADLTTVQTGAGEARHAGGGFELWVLGGRVGIRGGGAVNTVTDGGSSRSFGASVVIQSGAYLRTLLEAQITGGSDATRRGWSAGLRTTF